MRKAATGAATPKGGKPKISTYIISKMEELSMYEFLIMLLPDAEEIGEILNIRMHEDDPVFGNQITISGVNAENRTFELRLIIKGNETSGEK